jgi:hypothetical protein
MKKEIIKPFDLEKAKAGAKLRTRCGLPVEIFKWDARGEFPIRGIVTYEDEDKSASWKLDGSWIYDPNYYDLVIVEEVEPKFWSDNKNNTFGGFFIDFCSDIEELVKVSNTETNYNVFATEKQAKSALAMARISQIMANDIKNFGGVITDEEWKNDKGKAIIYRNGSSICKTGIINDYYFLAFHTEKQRDLFLEKYPQLVKDYLMINE